MEMPAFTQDELFAAFGIVMMLGALFLIDLRSGVIGTGMMAVTIAIFIGRRNRAGRSDPDRREIG